MGEKITVDLSDPALRKNTPWSFRILDLSLPRQVMPFTFSIFSLNHYGYQMIYYSKSSIGFNPIGFLFRFTDGIWLYEITNRTYWSAVLNIIFYLWLGILFFTMLIGFIDSSDDALIILCALAFFWPIFSSFSGPRKVYRLKRSDIIQTKASASIQLIEWLSFSFSMYLMLEHLSVFYGFEPLHFQALVFLCLGIVPLAELSYEAMRKL